MAARDSAHTVVALLVGAGLAFTLWMILHTWEQERVLDNLERAAKARLVLMTDSVERSVDQVSAVERFFASSDFVSEDEFRIFTQKFLADNPSIVSFEWVPRVRSEAGGGPSSFRPLYAVPGTLKLPQHSLDHYADPQRKDAMDQAARLGKVKSAFVLHIPELKAVGEAGNGLLLMLPVFTPGLEQAAQSADDDAVAGFVVAVFSLNRFASDTLERLPGGGPFTKIYADDDNGPTEIVYSNAPEDALTDDLSSLEDPMRPFAIAGKRFWLSATSSPDSLKRQKSDRPELVPVAAYVIWVLCVFHFSSRRRHDEQMEVQQRWFHELSSQAPVGIFRMNIAGECEYCNEAWVAMTGVDLNHSQKKSWYGVIHPEDVSLVEERWAEALRTEEGFSLEYRCHNPITGVRYLATAIRPVRNVVGELSGFIGSLHDVTAQRDADAAMRLSSERKNAIIDIQRAIGNVQNDESSMMRMIIERVQKLTHGDGGVVELVEGDEMVFRAVTGIAESSLGARIKRNGSLSGRCVEENRVLVSIDTELDERCDREGCRKLGIRSMIVVPLEKNGEVIGVLNVFSATPAKFGERDITTLQLMSSVMSSVLQNARALRALRDSEERFRLMVDSVFDYAFFALDEEGLVTSWNVGAERIFGFTADEVVGNNFRLFYTEAAMDMRMSACLASAKHQGVFSEVSLQRRRDGTEFWSSTSFAPLRDVASHVRGYLVVTHDITERKLAAQRLDEKNRLLEEEKSRAQSATQAKSQFLANMSHEIRTPLTSIIGFSEAMLGSDLDEAERQDALSTIIRNGHHLLGVLNDILDLSKIEAGKLDIEKMETSLAAILCDVKNLMRPRAEEKGISFGIELAYPIPSMIVTDPTRLKQILINLSGNAIKFTKSGGVKLSVRWDKEIGMLHISVIDTGIGMTEAQRKKLFQAFAQADTTTTREFGGTGLGLVISAELAARLGGRITVQSVPKWGSNFTFSLETGPLSEEALEYSEPVIEPERELKPIDPRSIGLKGRVLLAEDGADNQKYISFLLKRAMIDVKIAENGAKAIEALEREKFDLILMDMQMPVMDGLIATRTLRDKGFELPIIALTANAMSHDLQNCRSAGCTDFLAKPFEQKAFFETLAKYLERSEKPPTVQDEGSCAVQEDQPVAAIEAELVGRFVSRLPKRVAAIQNAIDEGEWDELRMLAHQLKGAAQMFGFPGITDVAAKLESEAVLHSEETAGNLLRALRVELEKASQP